MLIGLSGNIGCGKTTVEQYLQSQGFVSLSFADALKKIGKIFGFDHDQMYGTQQQKMEIHKNLNVSGREFLQKVGTELFRNNIRKVLPNFSITYGIWSDIVMRQLDTSQNTVISDVRFLDEVKMIKDKGGIIIRIVRDNREIGDNLNIPEPFQTDISQHASEKMDIPYDFIIYNDGSLEKLYNSVKNLTNFSK